MNYIKSIYKPLLYTFSIIFISCFIYTVFSYFNIISYNLGLYIKLLISVIAFFIGGFIIGKNSIKKGYIEGIKLSLILIVIMIIISIIFKVFKYKSIIYYLVLILSCVIGSMIGINKKNKD